MMSFPSLTADPIFGSMVWPLLILAAIALGSFFIRESRPLRPTQLLVLNALRLLVLLLALVALLRPGLTYTSKSEPRGAIAVMIDLSTSMELAGEQASQSRWTEQMNALKQILRRQSQFGRDTSVVIYGYDEKLRLLSSDPKQSTIPDKPTGNVTDIGGPIAELIATQLDPPLSSVIWMGDGTQTLTPSQADPLQLARQLAQMDIPLFMVGIGPRADSERTLDLAIESVPEQIEAFSRNQVVVRGLLHARGVVHRELEVGLFLRGKDGNEKLLTVDTLTPDQMDQNLPFRLPMTAPDEGSYELAVRVKLEDGELIAENNESIAFLNVRKGGTRILYIEGEFRPEQKFLRRSLADSQEFQVDFQLIPKASSERWPEDRSDAFKSETYSAFILGDVDSAALGQENLRLLVERVRNGAGLLTLGGYHAYGPGGYGNTPLASILPFQIDSRVKQPLTGQKIEQLHWPGPISLVPQVIHPITSLGLGDDNDKQWKELKPFLGANRWGRMKDLPGVRILAAGSDGQPLLVSAETEKGRVLCAAFDSSYQWWLQGRSELHRQFWRQAILWIMRRESTEESIRLEMNRRQRLYRDQSADVMVHWTPGDSGKPIPAETSVKVYRAGREVSSLILSRKDDRTMTARLDSPTESGRYELRATTMSSSGKELTSTLPFVVSDVSIESIYPVPDWQLIAQMARANESAGGGSFASEQIDEIMDVMIERKEKSAIELVESYRLGDGNIDSWALFLAFFVLMTIQWLLRKRWSLA